jgi:hypothetical protein
MTSKNKVSGHVAGSTKAAEVCLSNIGILEFFDLDEPKAEEVGTV